MDFFIRNGGFKNLKFLKSIIDKNAIKSLVFSLFFSSIVSWIQGSIAYAAHTT